jgi:hypothetical protein
MGVNSNLIDYAIIINSIKKSLVYYSYIKITKTFILKTLSIF